MERLTLVHASKGVATSCNLKNWPRHRKDLQQMIAVYEKKNNNNFKTVTEFEPKIPNPKKKNSWMTSMKLSGVLITEGKSEQRSMKNNLAL